MKIMFLTPNFNYACGRSYYIFSIMSNLINYGYELLLVTNDGDSLDRIADIKLKFICDKKLFNRSVFKLNYQINLLSRLISDEKVDVIHTCHRFAEFLVLLAIRKSRNKKVKTVLTALSHFSNRYYFEFRSDKIIGVSDIVVNNLIARYNVEPAKIIKIPNFVHEDTLGSASVTYNHFLNKFKLLCVARFHSDKGIDTLLATMKILRNLNVHLTLIGEGELKNHILGEIENNNLNITVIPPQRNLVKYYQSSDLCVLSSLIDPFPTFMLQAGLYEKPFIGTDISGINELIIDGKNGFLVPVNNPVKLAEKIKKIMDDNVLLSFVANNLYNEVKLRFTEKSVIPQIIKVYESL